jgi:hypothetical protein
MKRLSIIAAIIIIIALFAWAPWMTEASAKDSAKTAFEAKWKGVIDGCGFNCDGCGVKEATKILFGYAVEVEYACGLLPADSKQYHTLRTFKVYSFGVTKEIVPKTEQPPTIAPATPALTISNFSFSEAATGPTACAVEVENKIMFSGPLTKPTPCNGLAADYTATPDTITINITTTPFEGFCAQVVTDSFYTGSFDISPAKDFTLQIYYGGEQICRQVLTLS